ncbi:MAG: cell wall-binding repeat-containing protein [Coriobacteriia bacterium]|nr:cell wall-binding repeat-containing protein [Coriobacteriia bacterium]
MSAGDSHSLGIKEDGTLWAWGLNGRGQFDNGTRRSTNVPILIDGSRDPITRVSGPDRYGTAIDASKKNFDFESANAVILATGMNYADVLSTSALAGSLRAPLLLTRPSSLSPGALDEVRRLEASKVYIMGSTAAVSEIVEGLLTDVGLSIERIGGNDRYETSALIANKIASFATGDFAKKALIARGDNFADGLAVSPLACT